MKTIGLLGGMSWESTVPYYRIINQMVGERLGGLHSAELILYSVDFHPIEQLQHAGRWDETGVILARGARRLAEAGADCIVLCTNTMHVVAEQIQAATEIPLLHITDAVAAEILASGVSSVGLLGTKFTMEQDFYRLRLEQMHGLQVVIPDQRDREVVHRIIYEELCLGKLYDQSRVEFRRIIADLGRHGAKGVILGCTEIGMLIGPDDSALPLYDSAHIHARAAAKWALS